MTTSVITNNGRAFIASNSSMGLQVTVAGAVFGGQTISTDLPTLESYTTMPNVVYTTNNTSLITYSQIDDNNVLFRVRLGSDIGTFNIGAHGLLLSDGTLFTLASLDAVELKSQAAANGSGGNIRFYETIVNISSIANIVNLSILLTDDASLPEVATEVQLPNPNSSSFSVYFVHQWLSYRSEAALASRYNGVWNFYPCFDANNQNLFAANVVPGDAVYFDVPTGLFTHAVYNVTAKSPVGLCGEDYNLVRIGGLYQSKTAVYQPGVNYYVDSNNPGKLTTAVNNYHVGYAITSTLFSVNNIPDTSKTINNQLTVSSDASYGNSVVALYKNDAAADSKLWNIYCNTNAFYMEAANDGNSAGNNFFSVMRQGYNVTSITVTVPNSVLTMSNGSMRHDVPNAALIMGSYSCQLITSNAGVQLGNGTATTFAPGSTLTLANNSLTYGNTQSASFNITGTTSYLGVTGASLNIQQNQIGFVAGPFGGISYGSIASVSGISLQTLAGPACYFNLNTGGITSNMPIATSGQFSSTIQSDGSAASGYSAPTLISEFINAKIPNGYQRLPSGLLIQWGRGLTATGYLDLLHFPVAFLSAAFSITANEAAAGGWRNDNNIGYPTIFGVAPNGNGSFFMSCIRVDFAEGYSTDYQSNISYNYIAIGY